MKNEVIDFLLKNGYKELSESSDFRSFHKDVVSSVDISDSEVILVGDIGDWLHLPLNTFALIGALLHYRQISTNYINPTKKELKDLVIGDYCIGCKNLRQLCNCIPLKAKFQKLTLLELLEMITKKRPHLKRAYQAYREEKKRIEKQEKEKE